MQSAEGMPSAQVAWGRLSGDADLENLLKIHRLEFDLAHKTLPIARQHGSNLMTQIVATLQNGHKFPGLQGLAEPVRLGLLVGHDTNIATVSRLLNVGWQIPGFQPNEASPGGALAFELLREVRTGRRYVRLAYYAQTLDQMRKVQVLDFERPPGMVAVDLPSCAERRPRKGLPAGALRGDRQRGDRSGLRDDQAVKIMTSRARPGWCRRRARRGCRA